VTINILKLSYYSFSEPRSTAGDYMSGGGRRHMFIIVTMKKYFEVFITDLKHVGTY